MAAVQLRTPVFSKNREEKEEEKRQQKWISGSSSVTSH